MQIWDHWNWWESHYLLQHSPSLTSCTGVPFKQLLNLDPGHNVHISNKCYWGDWNWTVRPLCFDPQLPHNLPHSPFTEGLVASVTAWCSRRAVSSEMCIPLVRLCGLLVLVMQKHGWGQQIKGIIQKDLDSGPGVSLCRRLWGNVYISLQSPEYCDYLLAAHYCKLQQPLGFWCSKASKS